MAFSASMNVSVGFDGEGHNYVYTATGGGRNNLSEAVPGPSTNLQMNWQVDVSTIKAIKFLSDIDLTIKTNSSGSPADTITLTANQPLFWHVGMGLTSPLGTDVTTIFVTAAGSVAGTLKVWCITDVTP